MVRIRVKEGFWGTLTFALLWGCMLIGMRDAISDVMPPNAWLAYPAAGCLVGMLMFGSIRDLVRAWLETGKR
jgi:hypothetical protein